VKHVVVVTASLALPVIPVAAQVHWAALPLPSGRSQHSPAYDEARQRPATRCGVAWSGSAAGNGRATLGLDVPA